MKNLFLAIIILGGTITAQAQYRFNFFTGPDAELMQTTHKGFGSVGWDFPVNKFYKVYEKQNVSFFAGIGFGLSIKKYRFQNNFNLRNEGDYVSFTKDDQGHYYGDQFFSYSKSKLVTTNIRVFPEIGIMSPSQKISISVAPILDLMVQAKAKRKFQNQDGSKDKEVSRGVSRHHIKPIQYGLRISAGSYTFGVYGIKMMTRMFTDVEFGSPDVTAAEIGLYYRKSLELN